MWHVRAGRRHFLPPESRMLVRPCATPVRQGIVSHEQHRRHRPHVHLWPALILGREQCGVTLKKPCRATVNLPTRGAVVCGVTAPAR
jgi:hypothetical protein